MQTVCPQNHRFVVLLLGWKLAGIVCPDNNKVLTVAVAITRRFLVQHFSLVEDPATSNGRRLSSNLQMMSCKKPQYSPISFFFKPESPPAGHYKELQGYIHLLFTVSGSHSIIIKVCVYFSYLSFFFFNDIVCQCYDCSNLFMWSVDSLKAGSTVSMTSRCCLHLAATSVVSTGN